MIDAVGGLTKVRSDHAVPGINCYVTPNPAVKVQKRAVGTGFLAGIAFVFFACGKDASASPDLVPAALNVVSGQELIGN
jgi:hypothetical protein